jgi:hypothetical protein
MGECALLSDRMPAVALGRSKWSSEQAEHLERCAACSAEWKLVQVSSQLGQTLDTRHHPAATAQVVLRRLGRRENEARSRRTVWGFAALASAAAAAALIWAGWTTRAPDRATRTPMVATLQIQLPELDDLLPAELNAVLQTMDEPYIGGSAADSSTGDPADEDLDTGFTTLEG